MSYKPEMPDLGALLSATPPDAVDGWRSLMACAFYAGFKAAQSADVFYKWMDEPLRLDFDRQRAAIAKATGKEEA